MFSHFIARGPGARRTGAIAIRPLAAVLGCAAVITVAGCKPGVLTSASSSGTPTATASAGGAQMPAADAMTTLASKAQTVTSFVATLKIHATGSVAAQVSGTLTEQVQPAALLDVRTTVPAGLEAILSGNTAFLKIGALTRTAGKPWVSVPLSGLKSSSGASLTPVIQQIRSSNPLAQTQMFAAATNVRRLGTSKVSGVQTTEYTGSYSLASGLAMLTQSLRSHVKSSMAASGVTSTRFTVWVDSSNQVRKISLLELGKSARIAIDLVIVSINQQVHIQIPAASTVVGAMATPTPKPSMTVKPAPTMTAMPTPTMSAMPTPTMTAAPTPVASTPVPSAPAPVPSDQPTHW